MALPTLIEVSDFTARTFRRFTISVLAAYVAAILAVVANHTQSDNMGELYPYIMTCLFAFPFALAVDLFTESKKTGAIGRFLSRIFVLGVVGAAYYFVFKYLKENFEIDGLKSFLMFLSATVLVFLSPFFCREKANAFWQFSVSIVVRFAQAFVYFGILFIGIALLIQSVDYLFQLNLDEEYFADAWFIIVGIFASVYGLSGVPSNFKSLDQTTAYPKFLRVLTEYFLVPLVSLYLIVLYVYSAKILITWEWPLGGVASWIMGFSAVGVLTYFFIYSVKEKFLRYVEFYKKWFFVALLPLLLVLALSIGIRIQTYAVTQDRYFVVAFGIWAFILAIFYLITKSKNLKFMAASLLVILLATMYGPQSVFVLPKTTQMARLESILLNNNILLDGKVVKVDSSKVSQDDGYAINSIMNYVAQNYGVEVFQPWFTQNLAEIKTQYPNDYWTKIQTMEGYMGIDMAKFPGPFGGGPGESGNYKNFNADQAACQMDKTISYPVACSVDVAGYKSYVAMDLYGGNGYENPHFKANGFVYVAKVDAKTISFENVQNSQVLATIDLKKFLDNLSAKYPGFRGVGVPIADMTVNFEGGTLRFNFLNVYYENDQFKNLDNANLILLLK